jgi:subfamily B ATP-binding cassette protein MsbA
MLRHRFKGYVSFFRQCLTLVKGERATIAVFILLSVVSALTEGVGMSLLASMLDATGGPSSFARIPLLGYVSSLFADFSPSGRIQAIVIVMAVVLILRNLLQYAVELLGYVIPLRLEQRLNIRSYLALIAVEISYINEHKYGHLVNGVGGWSSRVTSILRNVSSIIWNVMIVAVYVAVMLLMSWRLTLMTILFFVVMSLALRHLNSQALLKAGQRLNAAVSRVNQIVMETITGMRVVRLCVAEPVMTSRYSGALREVNMHARTMAKLTLLNGPLLSTCAGLFICALLFGNSVVQTGEPSTWIGPILLFLFLLLRLLGPVSSIHLARNNILGALNAFDLLVEFYRDTNERRQPNGSREAASLRQAIVLDRVSFSYQPGEKPTLRDISATIERGKMVAVVGPSGAGKSTLINMVARLYDPQQGRILIDGVDLREFDVRSWRRRIAVVTQDTYIFNDTVANNISFGHDNVPRERIEAAARLAAASEFVEKLPQGYDTLVGDRGVRLSGGQQQRVAIARAILSNPDLLIFDEATSHLDTISERAIQDAMENMSKGRTLLVVAHRLSTIRKADKVIVMDEGRVVEEGQHRDLLARRGIYWEMVEHQRLDLLSEDAADAAIEATA